MIQRNNRYGWLLLIGMLLSSMGAKADGTVTFETASSGKAYLSTTADMNADATTISSLAIDATSGATFYVILKDYKTVTQDIKSVTARVYVDGGSAQVRRRVAPNIVEEITGTSVAANETNGYSPYNIYKVEVPKELSSLTSPTIEVSVELQDKVNLASDTNIGITFSSETLTYNGNEQHPSTVTVTDGSTTLNENEHYTVTWPTEQTAAGEHTATITAVAGSHYYGAKTATYTINQKALADANPTFTFDPTSAIYKENASHEAKDQTPGVTIGTVTEADYQNPKWQKQNGESWEDVTTVGLPGTYRMQIEGKGNYSGTATSQNLVVSPYTLTDANVTVTEGVASTITYDGAEHQPTIVVKVTHDGTEVTLRENDDYTITYPDGYEASSKYKAAGEYTFTVTGTGNYTGSGSATFTIAPKDYSLAFSGSGQWATFYNEEEIRLARGEAASGLTAYYVTAVSEESVTAEAIEGDVIPAKAAVLLNRGENNTATTFECEVVGDATSTSGGSIADFVGVSTATEIDRGSYILVGNEFVRSNEGTLPAGRCYLKGLGTAGARTRTIINNGDGTTGIDTISTDGHTEAADQWFSLDGRRISAPRQKGIYIKNNQKVVIK